MDFEISRVVRQACVRQKIYTTATSVVALYKTLASLPAGRLHAMTPWLGFLEGLPILLPKVKPFV